MNIRSPLTRDLFTRIRGAGASTALLCLAFSPSLIHASPHLEDEEGRTLILRGINLGWKASPYVPDVDDDDFEQIASWGFNTIRFLIFWAAIEPEQGVYDEDYLARIRPYLDMAYDHHLDVILDMHQDVYGEMFNHDGAPAWACPEALTQGFENQEEWWMDYFTPQVMACFSWFWNDSSLQEHFIESWRLAARELGNHPAVIGVDLLNEPYPGFNWSPDFEPNKLQPLYENLIPTIREEAPNALIFFEPWVLRDYFISSYLEPMPFEGLVYFPHYYNIGLELNQTYSGNPATIHDWMNQIAEEAQDMDVPFAVGEYSGVTESEGITLFLEDFNQSLDAAMTGGMYWEYRREDQGYGILDAEGEPKEWIVDALVRAWPSRVAGALQGFEFDEDTHRLQVDYTLDASIDAPTEITAPHMLYPDGIEVSLSAPDQMEADYDEERGVLVIRDHGPDQAPRTIIVQPSASEGNTGERWTARRSREDRMR